MSDMPGALVQQWPEELVKYFAFAGSTIEENALPRTKIQKIENLQT